MIGTQHPAQEPHPAGTTLRFTHGAPTAEEIAAVTAVVAAMQGAASDAPGDSGKTRRNGLKRRRLLASAPLPWRSGRH